MKYINNSILTASDAASATGSKVNMDDILYVSFQVVFGDASAAGTLKIQASNDECGSGNQPSSFVPTNWSDLSGVSVTATAGGVLLIPKTDVCYRWIRAVYTSTGAGSTTITVNMMALGA